MKRLLKRLVKYNKAHKLVTLPVNISRIRNTDTNSILKCKYFISKSYLKNKSIWESFNNTCFYKKIHLKPVFKSITMYPLGHRCRFYFNNLFLWLIIFLMCRFGNKNIQADWDYLKSRRCDRTLWSLPS